MTTYAEAVRAAGAAHAASFEAALHVARTKGPEAAADLAWRSWHEVTREQAADLWRKIAGLPPAAQAATAA